MAPKPESYVKYVRLLRIYEIKQQKRPGLDFCDFRLERNSSEKPTFAQKSASHSNFEDFKTAKVEREARFSSKSSFSFEFCFFRISEIRMRSRFSSKSRLFARVSLQPKIAKVESWAFFCLNS